MLTRSEELIDNGNKYTLEEVKAIENVENYLNGYKYDKSTILSDVDTVGRCYRINPGHKLLKTLDIGFMKLLNKRAKECELYSKTVLEPKSNDLFQEVLEFERLPFRYSKNPLVDEKIIRNIVGIECDYPTMIQLLSVNSNCPKLGEIFYNTLHQFEVTYSDFGNRPKMGWIEKMPNSDKEIYDKFLIAKDNYYKTGELGDSKSIGDYAELKYYKFLNKNRKPNERLLWVSRFLGDGFGYDIMSYNTKTKEVVLYEIKGSVSLGNSTKIELSERETAMFKFSKENNIEYHMVKVFFKDDEEKIYDIYYKDGKLDRNIINDRERYLILPSDENARKLTYELL